MNAPRVPGRFDPGVLGNVLVIAALVALAIALLGWQVDPVEWREPGRARWGSALAVVGLWVGFTGLVRVARRHGRPATRDTLESGPVDWRILHASQTGFAEEIAGLTADALRAAGQRVVVQGIGTTTVDTLAETPHALFVVSTTGEGDPPDPALRFVREAMQAPAALGRTRYGLLALGDREYDAYCAFGHRLDAWLRHSHAQPLFDPIEVDNGEPGALRLWQQHLGQLVGHTGEADWSRPRYQAWRLRARHHVNPGSPGAPVFDLALTPEDPAHLDWTAGDIAEIGPCHASDSVEDWLERLGADGDAAVEVEDGRQPLRDVLARSQPPAFDALGVHSTAQALADGLQPLPHREYSIASTPAEGELRLLVRQMRGEDGRLGSGSGWLTAHAPPGARIDLRIRRNAGFHPPADERPLVLIGNGTGLAGLRALLRARIEQRRPRNWLLFGERTHAHDRFFEADLAAWLEAGQLSRLDRVFSRDAGPLRYVQDLVRDQASRLDEWVQAGAAIHVCGSLQGMAPGVDAALRDILGDITVDTMIEAGRYRRDVY
ncbi:flavodoxin domain-containing protein [Lysobacter sp. SG-8]|uniref:NADPH--hemoprotein reductase n=1 Tax=Marilutibacter penaei TaxID=2759900 RepID=A0A7W3U388_9GAMM|nr:sulfite reductase subunit alpha [Lysobacter penaei]MBB1088116.1 flavodoxin domain-containing protein [Lysobacter penaei]